MPEGKWHKRTCPECSLKAGGYHEAIIQVRGPFVKARRLATNLVREVRRKTFVVSVSEVKNGFDILAGRKKPAIQAVQALGLAFKKTNKLVTQNREGKRLYRVTLCIRLDED